VGLSSVVQRREGEILGDATPFPSLLCASHTHVPKTHTDTGTNQVPNNDFVLTTRELGRLFRLRHIHLPSLKVKENRN
jgi:hypothetical protein